MYIYKIYFNKQSLQCIEIHKPASFRASSEEKKIDYSGFPVEVNIHKQAACI